MAPHLISNQSSNWAKTYVRDHVRHAKLQYPKVKDMRSAGSGWHRKAYSLAECRTHWQNLPCPICSRVSLDTARKEHGCHRLGGEPECLKFYPKEQPSIGNIVLRKNEIYSLRSPNSATFEVGKLTQEYKGVVRILSLIYEQAQIFEKGILVRFLLF